MKLIPAAFFFSVICTLPSYALDTEKDQMETWYQVEVLIFSQQDLFNAEQPRRDIELAFPESSRYLIDPNKKEEEPESTPTSSPDTEQLLDTDNALAGAVLDVTADPSNIPEKPIEQPFVILAEDQMQLGPDHYTLNRAPGYRVLYHQAWRQPGTDLDKAPWIVVQGGDRYDNHFELEGVVRLVKSRHLHIQADIWKTRFEPDATTSVEAPSLPDSENLLAPSFSASWPPLPEPPAQEAPAPVIEEAQTNPLLEPSVEENTDIEPATGPLLPAPLLPGIIEEEQPPRKQFRVTDIVQLKQSLKLSSDKTGYLDHPNMGLLVTVKEYQPETDSELKPDPDAATEN